jgi:CheY-like chemotaxis protein
MAREPSGAAGVRVTRNARILVATDALADADLVRKLLADEFDSVSISTDPDRSVEDFERNAPEVLVLAFNTLEKAERYYLGLYRLGKAVHALPHRTVLLCNKDDVRRVYQLCRKEYFDDYVLFWPMTHDAPRLPMSVHHAVRQIESAKASRTAPSEFAAPARRIAELEAQLARFAERGEQRVEAASRSLRQMGQDIGAALDGFSRKMTDGELRGMVEVRDRHGFEDELARLKSEQIEPRLKHATEAVQPVREWVGGLKQELAPQLESARALQALADQVRPLVLMVDDDEFQHRLLAQLLAGAKIELIFASSGTEALGVLRRRRPDLVLMDIGLPDISGIEVTRRIKSLDQFATIPVVMITGHSEKNIVVDSLKAGAADFVVKPFDKATVLAKVHKMLGAAQVERPSE